MFFLQSLDMSTGTSRTSNIAHVPSSGGKTLKKLSVGLYDGSVKEVIPRGTTIPTDHTTDIYTAYDNQKSLRFPIYDGDCDTAAENDLIGEFTMDEIPLKPKGMVGFKLTYELDARGVLHATAVENSTGRAVDTAVQYKSKSCHVDSLAMGCIGLSYICVFPVVARNPTFE